MAVDLGVIVLRSIEDGGMNGRIQGFKMTAVAADALQKIVRIGCSWWSKTWLIVSGNPSLYQEIYAPIIKASQLSPIPSDRPVDQRHSAANSLLSENSS